MKKWQLLTSITLMISCFSFAQNLVPNPSLENYQTTFCGIMTATDFNATMTDWKNPTSASPAIYFTNIDVGCYNFQPDSQYAGPIGQKGTQIPRTGAVMAGIWLYTIEGFEQRQYLQIALDEPMVMGHTYVVSYYASLGDYMEYSIDKLGAYLSVSPVSALNDGLIDFTPQVLEEDFVDDTGGWTLISDTIVAEDNYSYLTIGNFFDDASTSTSPNAGASGQPGTYGAYYFVDDVSIVETIISDTKDIKSSGIEIFPNPIATQINIAFPENIGDVAIKVFNLQGMEMLKQHSSNPSSVTLDCSTLPAGAYFIELQNQEDRFIQKILKL